MTEQTSNRHHFFKIRTVRDQRFLIGWLIFSFVVSVILTSVIAFSTYLTERGANPIGIFNSPPSEQPDELPAIMKVPPWDVFGTDKLTFILVGYDSVDEFAHRSDTLMVGAVDFWARKVRVVSIPRDTYVAIPGHGFDRVNAAYAIGHERLARKTVEAFTGVDIDYTASINYDAFVRIVDILGGVDITVEKPMHYDDRRGNLHIHFDPGDYHMNGEEALEYARFRHDASGDFGRIERQQGLMKALFEQVLKPATVFKLTALADTLADNVNVEANPDSDRNPPDLTFDHIMSLVGFMTKLDSDSIMFRTVPTYDEFVEQKAILVPFYNQTRELFDDIFNDDDPIAWQTGDNVPTSVVPAENISNPEEVSTDSL